MREATIDSVRARFTALNGSLIHFDGPAGTQTPDSVIEAISRYLFTTNANLGGKFETSVETDAMLAAARSAIASFLGAAPGDLTFGANMTSLNFSLSRVASRNWQAGDEVVVTRLDHDANISPWLEIAHDRGVIVKFAELDGECRIDLNHLESLISKRTRVVAFPLAANSLGTVTPVTDIAEVAHAVGALAWADAVHYAPHCPINVSALECDVVLCSPYKFFGPHLGVAWLQQEACSAWRPYKVRSHPDQPGKRHETGTQPHELICGLTAAIEYINDVGWEFIQTHERLLGQLFLRGLSATGWKLHGPPTMERRVSTFALSPPDETPAEAALRLADAGFAVSHGTSYAAEVYKHLKLPEGAVRVGIVHTNTQEEVEQLLAALPH